MPEQKSAMSVPPGERERQNKKQSREHEESSWEHNDRLIDVTLENSFPASDPPAWTSGVAPPVRPAPGHEAHEQPAAADAQRAGESASERAGESDRRHTQEPSRDDASTDLIGRRDITAGPHEAVPGQPHGPMHRAHAGATGQDESLPLHRWSRDALYEEARGLGIKGRSRMTKAQLIEAVRAAQQPQSK